MLDARRSRGDHRPPPGRRLALAAALGVLSMGLLVLSLTRIAPAYLRASGGLGAGAVGLDLLVPLAAGLVSGGVSLALLVSALLPPGRGGPPRR